MKRTGGGGGGGRGAELLHIPVKSACNDVTFTQKKEKKRNAEVGKKKKAK